jgi:anthranilate synthase component I
MAQDSAQAGVLSRTLRVAPDLVALHAANPARYPYLLESVAHGTPRGRFDILFAHPQRSLVLDVDRALYLDGVLQKDKTFLGVLDEEWRASAWAPVINERLPFRGGWFVFLAYEFAGQLESKLRFRQFDRDVPLAIAVRCPAAVVRDHETGTCYVVSEAEQASLLEAIEQDVLEALSFEEESFVVLDMREDEAFEFLDAVERIKRYIEAGDVFQVNLSRRWSAELDHIIQPATAYRRLRAANPAPFAGLAVFPNGSAILSSSPERLVRVQGDEVSTRPIAGTYPRSADIEQDRRWSEELLAHPKERAEHVMLIDLERNDLGRVCTPGTVRVNQLMTVESYRHVHHIESEVTGRRRAGVTPAEVLRAVFPGGTITGCPKVRCMEILAELERTPRGAYTGSMGYINRDGSMDFNILIRTLVQTGARLRWSAGAGIVADSIPERELAETRAKARGMRAVLAS